MKEWEDLLGYLRNLKLTLSAVGLLPVVNMPNNSGWAFKGLGLFHAGVYNCQGTPKVKHRETCNWCVLTLVSNTLLYNKEICRV